MKQLQPFFSIIIPTCNRPRQLAMCLQSLVHQEYPRDCFEMIVVDDGSELSLEPVVAPLRKEINITLYKQDNAGPAAARNTGAKYAKGDFLVFTDDDCTATLDWLEVLAGCFTRTPDCLIGGRTVNRLTDNPF